MFDRQVCLVVVSDRGIMSPSMHWRLTQSSPRAIIALLKGDEPSLNVKQDFDVKKVCNLNSCKLSPG